MCASSSAAARQEVITRLSSDVVSSDGSLTEDPVAVKLIRQSADKVAPLWSTWRPSRTTSPARVSVAIVNRADVLSPATETLTHLPPVFPSLNERKRGTRCAHLTIIVLLKRSNPYFWMGLIGRGFAITSSSASKFVNRNLSLVIVNPRTRGGRCSQAMSKWCSGPNHRADDASRQINHD